jgi:hypothetical protein
MSIEMNTKPTRDYLIAIARSAAVLAQRHDYLGIAAIYDSIVRQGDETSHHILELHDVAQAFLRVALRDHVSAASVVVYQFLIQNQDAGYDLLRAALSTGGYRHSGPNAVVDGLVHAGILRSLGSGRYGVRYGVIPSLRPMVRDLVDPYLIRVWASVNRARVEAKAADEPVSRLAGLLGMSEVETRYFLKRFPL